MKFRIEDKEFVLATNWNEVTLKQYIQICKLNENKNNYKIEELFVFKFIEILSNASESELDNLEVSQIAMLSEAIAKLNDTSIPASTTINIDGVQYALTNLERLTMGEYVGVKTFMQDNNLFDVLDKILATLIRPVVDGKIEKYNSNTVKDRAYLFMDRLMVSDFNSLLNFFLNSKDLSTINTVDYSKVNQ